MTNDLKLIDSIQLEVSNDSKNYHLHKEMKGAEIISSFSSYPSTMQLLTALMNAGQNICNEGMFKTFRLRIIMEKGSFFLYDAADGASEKVVPQEVYVPEQERTRYNLLTKREKQVLCFLYRGYKQDAIAYVFGMSIHTIKKHRYNIYGKTGFRTKTELALWCEKYLHGVFEQTA